MRSNQTLRYLPAFLAIALSALLTGGCGDDDAAPATSDPSMMESSPVETGERSSSSATTTPHDTHMHPGMPSGSDVEIPVATLNWMLNNLLQEHVFLAAAAVVGILQENEAQTDAASAALLANSDDLADAVGLVYGSEAGEAFLGLWNTHIGFFVDYAVALVEEDEEAADDAVNALIGYAADFAIFLEGATDGGLDASTVEPGVVMHITTVKTAVDSIADGDLDAGFLQLRDAMAHMRMLGTPLAGAIGAQFPERFPGEVEDPLSTLKRNLNLLLQEHVFLAGAAVAGALKGIDEEFTAAAAALDANSADLEATYASVYGAQVGTTFRGLWDAHIGFFVDYTVGVAEGDDMKADEAVNALVGYTDDFAAFLASLNDMLDPVALQPGILEHVLTLKDAVDALADGDFDEGFLALRGAAAHMSMLANPLAEVIISDVE